MGIDIDFFNSLLFYPYAVKGFFHSYLKVRPDVFAYEPERVTICNRGVVIICVDVIAENIFGIISFADYGCARQRYFDCILVARNQIFQKTAFWVIITVRLINKINALHLDVIRIFSECPTVFGELLDIDNSYFQSALLVLSSHTSLYQIDKILFALNGIDFQTSTSKLFLCLLQKIDTIYNKEELRDYALARIIIGQVFDIKIRKRSLAAALSMPNNTFTFLFIKVSFNRFCREYLRIAHNMLLQSIGMVYVSYSVAQEEIETLKTEQTLTNALGRCLDFAIRFVLAIVFILRHIVVTQQYLLVFGRNSVISFLNRETILSFLSKAIIEGIGFADSSVISSLFQLFVVFHIVAEYHNLRDIQITAETGIGKPCLHTVALGIDSFMIVFLFHFNKSQRQAIDENGYVGTEVVA